MRLRCVAAGIALAMLSASAGAALRPIPKAIRRSAAQVTGQGTIGGQVLETNGKAVGGARVTLEASDGRAPITAETNAEGRFWFPSLATGLYDVRAYSKGRVSNWRKNVWVERGKQTNVTLRLQSKKPPSGKIPPPPQPPKP